jgi:LysM repeat protein
MSINGITNANLIRIGQVIKLSSGTVAPVAPAPTPTTPPTATPTTPAPATTYTVVARDTLSGIAARFGTTTRNLMSINGIADANRIRIGQVLTIAGAAAAAAPAAPASTSGPTTSYKVVAGDTLSGIASRFGTTTRNLMSLNGITNANFLRIGQVLRLS